jgi:hypothetical protein
MCIYLINYLFIFIFMYTNVYSLLNVFMSHFRYLCDGLCCSIDLDVGNITERGGESVIYISLKFFLFFYCF